MKDENEDIQDLEMGFTPREPGTLPWFQFWSNRWMGSETVTKMSLAHQAIYIRMMCSLSTYGSLSRDPWILKSKIEVKYETLFSWMEKNVDEGEVIHEEGCDFRCKQALIRRSAPTPNSESGRTQRGLVADSARSHGGVAAECSCKRWTLPKFLKLQTLVKKSSADLPPKAAGEERKGEQSNLSTSATRSRTRTIKPKPSPGSLSGKDIPDSEFNSWSLERQTLYSAPDCTRCFGDGKYSQTLEGTWQNRLVRCDCSRT
jgi:hypothetical protein